MNEQISNEQIIMKAMMAEDSMSALKIYCEERAKFDDQLASGLKDESKNYEKCWSFITAKAKKLLNGKSGHLMPSVIFGIAVHYFTESNKDLEKEVGKIAVEEVPVVKMVQELKKETPKVKEKKATAPAFERISIFDLPEVEPSVSSSDEISEEFDDEDGDDDE